jgi:poly-gamma-glutamate capsule biosynthesis protein CapA/YwtB (metallophosphatase superfamily)
MRLATTEAAHVITLALGGDVMTGRGIDQILPHPCDPGLYESYMTTALDYVELAETAHGPIPRPVDFTYPWGDALGAMDRAEVDVRIVNLETSVTRSASPWPKGINYRMSPENLPCLTAAGIRGCSLANNHTLDWGEDGLLDTIDSLARAGITAAGAGRDRIHAERPGAIEVAGKGRVWLISFGSETSGIPPEWAAGDRKPGVNLLPDLSDRTVARIAAQVDAVKRPGDLAVASIHWGGNWGYEVHRSERRFARALVDRAGIDLIHGHSSHHPKGVEIHRDRPILYGCGDLLNDYEGIAGHEEFRNDLSVIYLASMDRSTGRLITLELLPMRIRCFRLQRAGTQEVWWLRDLFSREGARFGTRAEQTPNGALAIQWDRAAAGPAG